MASRPSRGGGDAVSVASSEGSRKSDTVPSGGSALTGGSGGQGGGDAAAAGAGAAGAGTAGGDVRRKKRGILKSYYGVSKGKDSKPVIGDPLDINSGAFDADMFVKKMLKEKNQPELMSKDSAMRGELKRLDSEVQTLVYENYNKFISATDTIRKMKNKVDGMEEEMNRLASNMAEITSNSDHINKVLSDKNMKIQKLAGIHSLLFKLQFLFELPSRLKKCVEMKAYAQAVEYYSKATGILHQYEHLPAFRGIQADCKQIVGDLARLLKQKLNNPKSTQAEVAECIDLLLGLRESPGDLSDQFLSSGKGRIDAGIAELKRRAQSPDALVEFVAFASDTLFADVAEVAGAFRRLFLDRLAKAVTATAVQTAAQTASSGANASSRPPQQSQQGGKDVRGGKAGAASLASGAQASRGSDVVTSAPVSVEEQRLTTFVDTAMRAIFDCVRGKIGRDIGTANNTSVVQAIERFYADSVKIDKIVPRAKLKATAAAIVRECVRMRVVSYQAQLEKHFGDTIASLRTNLAMLPRGGGPVLSAGAAILEEAHRPPLLELLQRTTATLSDRMKAALIEVQAYAIAGFANAIDAVRGDLEGDIVRRDVLQRHLTLMNDRMAEYADANKSVGDSAPSSLLVVLARLCLNFESTTIAFLVGISGELFPLGMSGSGGAVVRKDGDSVAIRDIIKKYKSTAQLLLDRYVQREGLSMSRMLRQSVETKDWRSALEPQSVRPVMRRVVEEVRVLESEVGQLYEDDPNRSRSSDSGRRPVTSKQPLVDRRRPSFAAGSQINANLMNNIQKLFSERVEVFGPVEFTRNSIVTGIIKIGLKTFFESIRLRTFNKYGYQQVQVDAQYLKAKLHKYAEDEGAVASLLEEVVSSTINRCLDPSPMDLAAIDNVVAKEP